MLATLPMQPPSFFPSFMDASSASMMTQSDEEIKVLLRELLCRFTAKLTGRQLGCEIVKLARFSLLSLRAKGEQSLGVVRKQRISAAQYVCDLFLCHLQRNLPFSLCFPLMQCSLLLARLIDNVIAVAMNSLTCT